MRPFLTILLCGAIAAPAVATAQDLSPDTPQAPVLAPVPGYAPLTEAPAPTSAPPAPSAQAVAPPTLETPTDVAPVLVEAPEKNGLGKTVGTVAGGLVGGVAGAAVAGPIGKFAGGFIGKRLAKSLFGGKKDAQQVQELQPPPSADQAAAAASATTPAPRMETVATSPSVDP